MLGFRGPIYATPATIDLLGAAARQRHIQEKSPNGSCATSTGAARAAARRHPAAAVPVIEAQYCLGLLQP